MLDPARYAPDVARLLGRDEYERMVRLGFFEDERVELLYGVVVQMTPKGAPQEATLQRLTRVLVLALADRADVRIQSSFAASDGSEPEPDAAVVPSGDYDEAHPTEAWLLVEVSHTSLPKDRGLKATLYAESGVPEYWVVNLPDRVVEVHTSPEGGEYRSVVRRARGESIRLCRARDVEIAVSDFLR